jgi:hypothetical protein
MKNTKSTKVTPLAFYELCNNHDWFHDLSNNPKVQTKGLVLEAKLEKLSRLSPVHGRIYRGFYNHFWRMDPFKSNRYISLPRRPKE